MNNNTTNAGIGALSDQDIAFDLLASAKAGVKMYATALTEAATAPVREVLKRQLSQAIDAHERVFNYVSKKGLYQAYDINQQLQMDMQNAQKVINTMQ